MIECPKVVLDLIKRFKDNRLDCDNGYGETSLAHETTL
jgi:hypothetical protein